MRFYRPIQSVKAMTFDLDDTLYDNEPIIVSATQALTSYIATHFPKAAQLSQPQWNKIKRDLINGDAALASDMGELRLQSLLVGLAEDIPDQNELHRAAKACFDHFYAARSDFSLAPDVHDVLAALAEKVPLIAITNGNVDPEKTGLSRYFQHILHASVSRPAKPHRHMFDEAAALLDIEPQHILHVGDNLEKDVMGAINAGAQTAWLAVNRPMQLNDEQVSVLPHIELKSLGDLLNLVN